MKNHDYRGFYRYSYITLLNGEKSLYIEEISADKYGYGYGSSMLQEILNIAEENNVSCCLNANCDIYEEKGLTQEELEEWYFRYGFNPALDLDPFNSTNFFYRDK